MDFDFQAKMSEKKYDVNYIEDLTSWSAEVLLNLLNKLGKKKSNGRLAEHLCLFRNKFNKFNNTGLRMLDSICHMTFRLL